MPAEPRSPVRTGALAGASTLHGTLLQRLPCQTCAFFPFLNVAIAPPWTICILDGRDRAPSIQAALRCADAEEYGAQARSVHCGRAFAGAACADPGDPAAP